MLLKSAKLSVAILLAAGSLVSAVGLTACSMKQPQESVGQYVDAGVTTTAIKSKILADKSLSNTTITVKTYKNTVQLSGFVNNNKQKMRAEQIARNADGVGQVENDLIIKK